MQETAKANIAGIRRFCQRSDQPKIETLQYGARLITAVESSTGQRLVIEFKLKA